MSNELDFNFRIGQCLTLIRLLSQGKHYNVGNFSLGMGEDGTIGFIYKEKVTGSLTFKEIYDIVGDNIILI